MTAAVILSGSTIASAHAELRESSPAAGERLAESPAALSLHFTESVQILDDPIRLLGDDGAPIDIGVPRSDGPTVTVDAPPLADGGYVVDWNVVSADGHPIDGAFTFSVGDASLVDPSAMGGGGASDASPRSLVAWRALTYAGWSIVVGVWAFVVACWPGGRRDRPTLVLLSGGALLALIAASLRVAAEAATLDTSLGALLDLRSGRAWFALVALAAVSLVAAPAMRSGLRASALVAGWLVTTSAVGVAVAFAGHGANGRVAVGGTVLTVAHVAAASVWIGGLVAMVRCLVHADPPVATTAALRFSSLALASVVTLAVTGACQAMRELDGVGALTGSEYGRTLLVKLAIVLVVVITAWFSRRALRHRLGPLRLRRTVTVELAVAAIVFLATGWLAGASPNAAAVSSGPVHVTATDRTNTDTASVEISPGTAGANDVHVTISRPGSLVADEVRLQLSPADRRIASIDVAAPVEGDHAMADTVDIPYAGAWTLTVHARYGEFEVLVFDVPVTIR